MIRSTNTGYQCSICGLSGPAEGDLEGHECKSKPASVMNLREFLAVEVMGWKPYSAKTGAEWCVPDPKTKGITGKVVILQSNWNPRNNIEQAIMCAKKTGLDWSITNTNGICRAYVFSEYNTIGEQSDDEAAALSLAVARATGWEE